MKGLKDVIYNFLHAVPVGPLTVLVLMRKKLKTDVAENLNQFFVKFMFDGARIYCWLDISSLITNSGAQRINASYDSVINPWSPSSGSIAAAVTKIPVEARQ